MSAQEYVLWILDTQIHAHWRSPRIESLRRPTTTNASHFWHVNKSKWDAWVEQVGNDKNKERSALQSLRRYDFAGRAMETQEGVLCQECHSSGRACVVLRDGRKTCAFCKVMSQGKCFAGVNLQLSGIEERMIFLTQDNAKMTERMGKDGAGA